MTIYWRCCAPLALGLALTACTPLTPSATPRTPTPPLPSLSEKPMDTAATPSPTLSAEDIGRRVIKLVQNLRTVDDISPVQLERQMGIKVQIRKEDPYRYGFGGPIEGSWVYDMEAAPVKPGETARRLEFSIGDRSPEGKADLTPVCTLSFNDYRDAFVAAGYSVKRIVIGRNNDPWRFTRDGVTVTAWMQRYADPEKTRACVRTLDIYFESVPKS